jgi:hypothetical protein
MTTKTPGMLGHDAMTFPFKIIESKEPQSRSAGGRTAKVGAKPFLQCPRQCDGGHGHTEREALLDDFSYIGRLTHPSQFIHVARCRQVVNPRTFVTV